MRRSFRIPGRSSRPTLAIGLLIALLFASGCSRSQSQSSEREGAPLRGLATLYGQCTRGGQQAVTEEQFRKYIASLSAEEVARWGVADREDLFVSNRDHKPYVVLYGEAAKKAPAGPAGFPVVAYEQEGVNGRRYVASSMATEELDETEFRALFPQTP